MIYLDLKNKTIISSKDPTIKLKILLNFQTEILENLAKILIIMIKIERTIKEKEKESHLKTKFK